MSASYDALFILRRVGLLEAHFHHLPARPPLVGRETFYEVTMISS
jgi:hypothetical protein